MNAEKRKHAPYMKFKGFMVEHGLKYTDIANLLELSTYSITCKINGATDFTAGELRELETIGIPHDLFF